MRKYPNCQAIWEDILPKLGDGKCDYALNMDISPPKWLNVESCGWDDGDCDEWNAKYTDCHKFISEY